MVGQTLAHFRVTKKLGSGGMGDVYLAQDLRLGRNVAIKVLSRGIEADEDHTARLMREAQAASALNHPNVAAIYDIGEAEGTPFIVMEYVDGPALSARIKDPGMTTPELLAIALPLADALTAAHARGITHRDVKPSNIMFTARGQLKVLDFGLATVHPADTEVSTETASPTGVSPVAYEIAGTLSYMSPEQSIGRPADHRTDIFSLGVVLYQLATARVPFSGATAIETIDRILHAKPVAIGQLNRDVDPELERIVAKCLEKEVERRYQSAGDLLADLKNLERDIVEGGRAVGQVASGTSGRLPAQVTSFIGRDRELAELKGLLTKVRLLTLTGVAGTGKTRLSLQVAAELSDHFSNGVWLVELAPLSDPGLVPQAIGASLGLPEEPNRPLVETIADYLRDKSVLLVIDNCEHVLMSAAQVVERLMQRCPRLHIMATSRERLGIAGEMVYGVPTLSLPHPPGESAEIAPASLTESEAARLFVDRATFSYPHFLVTPQNAPAIARICHHLDGIPLAIELAAARVKALSPEQISARIDDRFLLLTGGRRTGLPRQQTLQATVDWSYDLLSEKERQVWRRLAVFARGWTVEAAETVVAGPDLGRQEVLDLISQLVDKSIVNANLDSTGSVRYSLLETMRQYGWEKLAEAGETAALRSRHLHYFCHLAEQAEPHLFVAAQQWLETVEENHDNFREALDWGMQSAVDHSLGSRLVGALWMFWYVRCFFNEGRQWAEAAIRGGANAAPAEPTTLAKVTAGAARLAFSQGDYRRSVALCERCLDLQRDVVIAWPFVIALQLLGNCYQYYLGDLPRALDYHQRGLARARDSEEKWLLGLQLVNVGEAVQAHGDSERARALFEEGLALATEVGDRWVAALSLGNLGSQALLAGDTERAAPHLARSLALRHELRDKRGMAGCLEGMAILAQLAGSAERAARLFGAAEALRETIGASLTFVLTRADYDRSIQHVRSALAEERFDTYRAEGRSMTLPQAVAYALHPMPGAAQGPSV